ncbi:MAG: DUF362 domain-containing protein [Candidatus Hydrogenedentes bacterium]|nr:DUF362 domain-containing protein [Candidatus Hydrogenedentota bacterium]
MKTNRRTFLAGLGSIGVGAALVSSWRRRTARHASVPLGASSQAASAASMVRRARVISVRRPELFGKDEKSDVRGLGIDSKLVHQMVHESVTALVGAGNTDDAWKKLFGPRDVVGIKVNCLGGRMISSHPAIVEGIVQGLRKAGVSDDNIIVWDRFSRELKTAGFQVNVAGRGVKYLGTDARGYGYMLEPIVYRSIGSLFSSILTSKCNAIISVPVLKDHDLAGITLNLKNFFGAIQKPSLYHDNGCDPYIADLNAHPLIKDKMRLVVADALLGVYDGGPSYRPDGAWRYAGVLAATDPVAIDRVGANIVEAKRVEEGKPSLKDAGREPTHIHTAARLGLGRDEPDKIDVIEV